MRFGMMADVYKPHVSGITNYISLNKQYLEKQGHEVFVFTFGDPSFDDGEPNVIRTPGLPLVDTGMYFNFRYSPKVKRLLQTMDIVHVHHPFTSGRLALRYCRPMRIPVVFTNHTRYDLYLQAYVPLLPEEVGESFLQAYMTSFCRSVDLVISPSAGMEKILRDLGVDAPIKVIPNGVDFQNYRQDIQPIQREGLGIGVDEILLVYVGRIAVEKNMAFLIHAFNGVVQSFDHIRLMIVGDGPEKGNLQEMTQNLGLTGKVIFTGLVPYEKIPAYLRMCDGFVTSSVSEVHPLSVIEAMAMGIPVLGINSPGIGDTIQDGVNGYLVNNDLAAFTAKLVKMVTDPETRRRLGSAAKETAETYDITRTTQLVLQEYQTLIQQAAGKRKGFQYRLRKVVEKWRQ